MAEQPPLTVSFFGAPGSTRNLGVGALRESAVVGLLRRRPDSHLTVFDDGWGEREGRVTVDGTERRFTLRGVRNSRRVHKQESYLNMRLCALVNRHNPGLATVDASDAVWDISGGDSFADLYGAQRFRTVTLPKELALQRRRPLLLLPQTYGPFRNPRLRHRAQRVLRAAGAAWARDADSYVALQELLGEAFDPARHRLGVDIAFALAPAEPEPAVADAVRQQLASLGDRPLAGLNISGLLLNDPRAAARYGHTVDYRALVEALAGRLAAAGAGIVLVPHVLGGRDETDSDEQVTRELEQALLRSHPGQVVVAPASLGAGGRKWLIGQLDWFCGTRMHATIAALSSGVPTAAVAYSMKVRGVFASCRQQDHVADARALGTAAAAEVLWDSWSRREKTRHELATALPEVLVCAEQQMDQIVAQTESWRRPAGESATS